MGPSDTSEEIQTRMDAAYRRMSAAQKVGRVAALTQLAYGVALARLREANPGETERQLRIRLSARWLSRAQVLGAFGWDPASATSSPPP
jgi:hypothetical protein